MSDKVGIIRDPIIAVAVAKCWLWRWTKRVNQYDRKMLPGIEGLHLDAPCNFCDYPADALVAALEEFVAWSGIGKQVAEPVEFRSQIEAFVMLPLEEQRRRVNAVQYD